MKILILHLSDIHVKTDKDSILGLSEKIVNSIKDIEYELDAAFITVTGDISHSGKESQLLDGSTFLSEIQSLCEARLKPKNQDQMPTHIILVPGNHDCLFPQDDSAREMIINGILGDNNAANSLPVVTECLKPLSNFFDVRDMIAEGEIKYDKKIYWEQKFSINDEIVCFKCLNTAWMSKLKEKQGELIYPENKILIDRGEKNLIISLMHHPYSWMESENGRRLRRTLENVSDIILTGHEHDSEYKQSSKSTGESNTYIEGGILQDSESWRSFFNVLIIDTETEKQKFACLSLEEKEGFYIKTSNSVFDKDGKTLKWHDYQMNRLKFQEQFMPNKSTMEYLEDPGAAFSTRNDTVKLSDIYVFPDLKYQPLFADTKREIVSGDDLDCFLKEHPYVLVAGDYQSGKSSFGKSLFLFLCNLGEIPLLIDGDSITSKNFERLMEDTFVEQYQRELLVPFQQMDSMKRAVIIDDYHKIKMNPKQREKFIAWLCDFAGRVILIADELEMNFNHLTNPSDISGGKIDFEYYSLAQFGYQRRDVLIKKWLTRKATDKSDPIEFARRLDATSRTLNTLIGKNYVPAYPIYIISVLFASDAATKVDLSASTHAYFYELIIKVVIARGRNNLEYDITASYLSFLAYKMYKTDDGFTLEKYQKTHRDFEEKYEIKRPFEKMNSLLMEQHILSLKDDIYSFKHSFMFYYFVASYLKDNLYKDAEIREEIKHICQALYVEEYANILLFLAHLSKDPFIIEQLKNNAESIFENAPLAKLDNDIDFIGEINRKIKHITIPDIDKHQARQELLKKRDQDEEIDEAINRDLLRCDHPVERKQFVANPLLQLIASLKTLEILGQVLKNFPGSIEATEKLEITECCYKLGLRTLGFTFETLKGEEDALIETIMNVVREQYSDKHEQKAIDNETLKDMANKAIVGLTLSLSYSIIRRISLSVGTPELFTTYKKILDKLKHPSVKLIDCSLHLDQASHFPDKLIVNLAESFKSRWLPNDVLRRLVAQHLYLFDVPRDKKQRVCEKLKFDYTRVQAVDSKKKMIESKVKDTIQK